MSDTARVVVRAPNMKSSHLHLADCILNTRRAARAARLFFLIQLIKSIDLRRCRRRSRRRFLNARLLLFVVRLHERYDTLYDPT